MSGGTCGSEVDETYIKMCSAPEKGGSLGSWLICQRMVREHGAGWKWHGVDGDWIRIEDRSRSGEDADDVMDSVRVAYSDGSDPRERFDLMERGWYLAHNTGGKFIDAWGSKHSPDVIYRSKAHVYKRAKPGIRHGQPLRIVSHGTSPAM